MSKLVNPAPQQPDLTVIIGDEGLAQAAKTCLTAAIRQASALAPHLSTEIILVTQGHEELLTPIEAATVTARQLQAEPEALMPQLWYQGLEQAQGEIVAFTISQCRPEPGWLQQIVTAHQSDIAGVGGPIAPPETERGQDWALYFVRYKSFMPASVPPDEWTIKDIPGDNAAYKRAALTACRSAMADGFWETLVHRCLEKEGRELLWQPQMIVQLGPTDNLRAAAATRWRHGRHYGASRPGNTPLKRLLRTLSGPLIPFILLQRIVSLVRQQRPDWQGKLWSALPALLYLLLAWSGGEVVGYLTGRTAVH